MFERRILFLVFLFGFMIDSGLSYPTYEGCDDLIDGDFRYVGVIQKIPGSDPLLNEPIEMAFDPVQDAEGNTVANIYFVERRGAVKFYDALNKTVETIGTLEVFTTGESHHTNNDDIEDGLTGIVLDPGFKENQKIYLYYATPEPPYYFRISHFTLVNNKIDMNSEKVLIDIPVQQEICCHTGGAMAFDEYGDLWITTGNNAGRGGNPDQLDEERKSWSDEWGSSSTAGMRGGVLRIHPDDSEKGYSIPEGNFCEYFADMGEDYQNPETCLPEIYAKGFRNPYTITLDPVRQWAAIGDCSSDMNDREREEHSLMLEPGFYGWPYFAASNVPSFDHMNDVDPNAPVNDSRWNEGATILPPAIPATHPYPQGCAMTGPIYRYDPDLKSPIKFPPHFDRRWFVGDFNGNGWLRLLTLSEDGRTVTNSENMFDQYTFHEPLEFEMGPDGALYINNYAGWFNANQNTSIFRIEYLGDCLPDRETFTGVFEKTGCIDENYEEYNPQATHPLEGACRTLDVGKSHSSRFMGAEITGQHVAVTIPGKHIIEVRDAQGRKIHMIKGSGVKSYSFAGMFQPGIYFVELTTPLGNSAGKMVCF